MEGAPRLLRRSTGNVSVRISGRPGLQSVQGVWVVALFASPIDLGWCAALTAVPMTSWAKL